jgi:hypothetical protein
LVRGRKAEKKDNIAYYSQPITVLRTHPGDPGMLVWCVCCVLGLGLGMVCNLTLYVWCYICMISPIYYVIIPRVTII